MEHKKNNGIYWGLLIVICSLIGISFWERKELKREMELRVLREVTYSLVKEKLYATAWSYVNSYEIDDRVNITHCKNFVKQEAQRERERIWVSLKKTWQTQDREQREKNLAIIEKARQHQMLENIEFFDEKILELPKLKKEESISEKRLAAVEKKVMGKDSEKVQETVKEIVPEKAPVKKLSIEEQLTKDWEDLLAKEKPEVRGKLKEIEKYTQSRSNWRYMFRSTGKDILKIRSKALVPLLLSTMRKRLSRDYYSLQHVAKLLTILTGKQIQFTRYKTPEETEKLVEWWMKDKDKITTSYESWDRKEKDNCVQQIIEITTINNSYYASFYRQDAKFRSLKSVLDMLQKETSYRPFVDVKCIPEMIPQLLEHTGSQKWWGLVHIFRNMYKEGNFATIDKIVDSNERSAMTRFICVLALWKSGKTFSASKLFAIAQQETNPMNQALMIMVLRHAENMKDVIPMLLRKLDQSDDRLQQAICYSLEDYKPTAEQKFIFTPYLPSIEKMLIYSLNDNRALQVLANISSRQAKEILISYIEKVYKNPKQMHILSQGLKYVKQATDASWNTHKYYENNYQIAKQVIEEWRGIKKEDKTVKLREQKITWKKDIAAGKTFVIEKGERQVQYNLIRNKLHEAKSGDIVELPAGTYEGNFEIPTGVTFRGTSPSSTRINGTITLLSKATLENITVHSTNTPIIIRNANGALVKNCWMKGVRGRVGMQNISAVFVQNSSDVILMQNVIYDVGIDSHSVVMAIHMADSSGLVCNNIIGRIISQNNTAYAIHLERCQAVRLYNNTVAHVKSTNSSGYGIYIGGASSALVENNIVHAITGKESYGIVNQSSSAQVQYNNVFDTKLPYLGESHSNHIRDPLFVNDRDGNFSLRNISPCLAIANVDAKPYVEGIATNPFVNQLGAVGGHNVFDEKHQEFLQKFIPEKTSNFQRKQNVWFGYSGRMLKKYLHELRDPLKKMRAKIQIKRYKQTALEVLQMIADRKGPAEFRGLEMQAQQILSEMKREMQVGSWSFGK